MANKRHSKEWRITPGKITHPRSKVSGNEGGYKEFRIGDLFDLKSPKKKFNANSIIFGGKYRYVARGASDNGIRGFIDADEKYLNKGNTISFGQDTATAYYQSEPYFTGDKIKIMELKVHLLNELIAKFLVTSMKRAFSNFSWGTSSFNEKILNNTKISLPTKSNGEIDFDYMENFIEQIENERWNYLDQFLDEAGLQNCILTPKENSAIRNFYYNKIPFKTFKLVDIFTVKNTHSILKTDIEYNSGCDPYVTASEENNSVVTFISYNKDLIEEGNSIMIGGKTLTITYQSKDYYSNDSHNLALYLKADKHRTGNIQLFLVGALKNCLNNSYSWNDSISFKKIQKDEIGLPVTSAGDIDYEVMENFISAYKKMTIQNLHRWRAQEVIKQKIYKLEQSLPAKPVKEAAEKKSHFS